MHYAPYCAIYPRPPVSARLIDAIEDQQGAQECDRCAHDRPNRLPDLTELPQNGRMHLRLGQATRHDAQDQISRHCYHRCRLHAQCSISSPTISCAFPSSSPPEAESARHLLLLAIERIGIEAQLFVPEGFVE